MDDIEETISPTAFHTADFSHRAAAQLIRDLYNIYNENDPEFAYYLTWLAEDYGEGAFRIGQGNPGAESLERVLQDETGELTPNFDELAIEVDDIRFGAFFALCRLYQHRGELEEASELLNDYEDEFGDRPLFLVLQSEVLAARGGSDNFYQAIESAVAAETRGEEYIEAQHNLAHVISAALEQDYTYAGERDDIPTERQDLLQRAASAIDRAIGMDIDYAKCYITKAKIQALQEDFEEAKQLVWRGIEAVNRDRPADDQVLAEFRQELSAIDLIKQRSVFEQRTEQMREEFTEQIEETTDEYQIRTLQILVFFAGLLAVIVALIQVPLAVESFGEAAQLVPIIVGSLLVGFGGFSFLLPSTHLNRTVLLIITGILLIGAAIVINALL